MFSSSTCSVSTFFTRFFSRNSRTTFSGLSSTGDSRCNSSAILRARANAAINVTALSRPMPLTLRKSSTDARASACKRAELLQKLPADFDRVGAFQARAEQNGNQFRMAQGVRAVLHQPFARPFADRLVLQSEAAGHEDTLS